MGKTNLILYISIVNNNVHSKLKNRNNTLFTCSSGKLKFQSTTKKSLVAFETLGKIIVDKLLYLKLNVYSLTILFRGVSRYKKNFLKILAMARLPIKFIFMQQIFSNRHNGCKIQKAKRK